MLRRRRFKQTLSLSERLVQDVEHLKTRLATLPPGPERDQLLKRIRQNETAANIDQWLTSPGLQPPQAIRNLGE
jgi:hypothetical protein